MRKLIIIFGLIIITIESCTHETSKVRPPLMGWNSWNAYMVDISDSIIMNTASMMITKGLKTAGYDHVNIDDGFFGYRDSAGYMIPHPERFPNGIAHVPEGRRVFPRMTVDENLRMGANIIKDTANNLPIAIYAAACLNGIIQKIGQYHHKRI